MNKYQEALDEIKFEMALDTQNGSENVFIDLQEKYPDEFALLQELVDNYSKYENIIIRTT